MEPSEVTLTTLAPPKWFDQALSSSNERRWWSMPIIDAVNRWYAAWNAHDTAAIADAMSPQGTYLDPVLGSPIDRATTAEHAVSHLLTMFPDAQFEVLTVGAMS